jgi:hypothetical protein
VLSVKTGLCPENQRRLVKDPEKTRNMPLLLAIMLRRYIVDKGGD